MSDIRGTRQPIRTTPGPIGVNDSASLDRPSRFPVTNPGPTGINDTRESNRQIAEPEIVVCTLLCYLGIPPALWKTAVELLLRAVAEQYRSAYGVAQANKEFRAWKNKFLGYSALKVLKLVLEFSCHGKISFIPVTRLAPATATLHTQLQAYLMRQGARLGAQQVAVQVLRKVVLVTELVYAGGCLGKCGVEAGARAIVRLSQAVADGVVVGVAVIDGTTKLVRGVGVAVFVRPVLIARASLDQSNWVLQGLPDNLMRDLNATFGILWMTRVKDLTPDDFLGFVANSMGSIGIPQTLLRDISRGLANSSPPEHGLAGIFMPPEILRAEADRQKRATIQRIESMNVYEFVQYLSEQGYLRYRESPEVVADRQLGSLSVGNNSRSGL